MKYKTKIILFAVICSTFFIIFSVIRYKINTNTQKENDIQETEFDETMLYNISELSTIKVFYHNVIESFDEKDNIFDKNTRFWIEYESSVEVGIEAKDIEIENKGNKLVITLPTAKVLDIKTDESTFTKDSFYFDPKTKKPNALKQQEALQEARKSIKTDIEKNEYVLESAKNQAKVMLESYVKDFSEQSGIEYTIKWK